jgi:Flp pilus assembly protein TadD
METNPFKQEIIVGEELFLKGAFGEALNVFKAVLSRDPSNVEALNDAALASAELGATVEAARIYEYVLELAPDHERAFFNFLDLLLQAEAVELAVEAFLQYEHAIPQSPEKTRYHGALALWLEAQFESQGADQAAS